MQQKDDNPLVTCVLFSYNQEKYIVDAIQGVFAQTYRPIELIISDDRSTDSTYELICSEVSRYKGNISINLNRNDHNLGMIGHLNYILFNLVSGDVVIPCAGDDISLPGRAELAVKTIGSGAIAGCSNGYYIGDERQSLGRQVYPKWRRTGEWVGPGTMQGALAFYSSDFIKEVGPMPDFISGEDSWYTLHALARGKVAYVNLPTVCYRVSTTSSQACFRNGDIFRQLASFKKSKATLMAAKNMLVCRGLYKGSVVKILENYLLKIEYEILCLSQSANLSSKVSTFLNSYKFGALNVRDIVKAISPKVISFFRR